jgi:hypothetical protein
MSAYRCFFLNLRSAVAAVEIIEAENDDDALRLALSVFREQGQFAGFEVWDRGRRLHRQMRAEVRPEANVRNGR